MCLIAFAIGTSPELPLLLAGNRDEFFERPTEGLHRWPDGNGIWAGRDGRDRGTWLGVSESGRVALLTNVRSGLSGAGQRSRGELPVRWLQGEQSPPAFAADLDPGAYGGFNLVVGDLHRGHWAWLCNRDPLAPHREIDGPVTLHRRDLAPGIYGVSNAVLDTPWPKTQRLKSALTRALALQAADQTWLPPLQEALADHESVPPDELPATGVATDWEQALSSPFVRAPARGYGTRSSLVMQVRADGANRCVDLHEWTHTAAGWSPEGPAQHQLRW